MKKIILTFSLLVILGASVNLLVEASSPDFIEIKQRLKERHLYGSWVLTDVYLDEPLPEPQMEELKEILGTVRLTFYKGGAYKSSVNGRSGLEKNEGKWRLDPEMGELFTEDEGKNEEVVRVTNLSRKKMTVRSGIPGEAFYMEFIKIKTGND